MKGLFITLEGGEGSGKTTIASMLYNKFKSQGIKVIISREPGGVKISEEIREVIVDINNKEMDARTEALLYAAARRQHLVEKVLPVLNDGGIVICDRFIDSSLVYQGLGRNLGVDKVYKINQFATEGFMPKRTYFFDVTPEIALKRIQKDNQREINRLDLESLDFHNKVYEGYLQICEKYPQRIKKIDATQDIDYVFQIIFEDIKGLL